jgi:hypothetical protein
MKYGGRHMLPDTIKIGAIKAYQLQEARRRMIKQNILVGAKPKSMFKKS